MATEKLVLFELGTNAGCSPSESASTPTRPWSCVRWTATPWTYHVYKTWKVERSNAKSHEWNTSWNDFLATLANFQFGFMTPKRFFRSYLPIRQVSLQQLQNRTVFTFPFGSRPLTVDDKFFWSQTVSYWLVSMMSSQRGVLSEIVGTLLEWLCCEWVPEENHGPQQEECKHLVNYTHTLLSDVLCSPSKLIAPFTSGREFRAWTGACSSVLSTLFKCTERGWPFTSVEHPHLKVLLLLHSSIRHRRWSASDWRALLSRDTLILRFNLLFQNLLFVLWQIAGKTKNEEKLFHSFFEAMQYIYFQFRGHISLPCICRKSDLVMPSKASRSHNEEAISTVLFHLAKDHVTSGDWRLLPICHRLSDPPRFFTVMSRQGLHGLTPHLLVISKWKNNFLESQDCNDTEFFTRTKFNQADRASKIMEELPSILHQNHSLVEEPYYDTEREFWKSIKTTSTESYPTEFLVWLQSRGVACPLVAFTEPLPSKAAEVATEAKKKRTPPEHQEEQHHPAPHPQRKKARTAKTRTSPSSKRLLLPPAPSPAALSSPSSLTPMSQLSHGLCATPAFTSLPLPSPAFSPTPMPPAGNISANMYRVHQVIAAAQKSVQGQQNRHM